ncbi:MAG: DUF423 domain-containing protein [Acetobacteraceae bacterium]|nr:DUF423 domain-containing protein [Acetobacteraceae bacterium]
MQKVWIGLGGLAGLTAVGMAALAAHGLEAIGAERLQIVRNGVQMQGWHALALLACGLWRPQGGRLADWAGGSFVVGLLLFCGAVYAVALGGVHSGALAPIGGTLLMVGWALLGMSALRRR